MKIQLEFLRIAGVFAVIGSVAMLTGCAQFMAINQPKPFKPTMTVVGAKRVNVSGELGVPITSEEQNGQLHDVYKYVDGGAKNNGGSKTVRVILYTAGDLFTVFLDQVLTWPLETYGFAGTTHMVTVDYVKGDDGFWCVKEIDDKAQGANTNTVASAKSGSPRAVQEQTTPTASPAASVGTEPAPAAAPAPVAGNDPASAKP